MITPPPYMNGEEETQEHKDKPSKGVFKKQTTEEKKEQTDENNKRLKDAEKDN